MDRGTAAMPLGSRRTVAAGTAARRTLGRLAVKIVEAGVCHWSARLHQALTSDAASRKESGTGIVPVMPRCVLQRQTHEYFPEELVISARNRILEEQHLLGACARHSAAAIDISTYRQDTFKRA